MVITMTVLLVLALIAVAGIVSPAAREPQRPAAVLARSEKGADRPAT